MAIVIESGLNGSLISLAGYQGVANRGRQSEATIVAIDNTAVVVLLPINTRRISAIIYNDSNQDILLSLGDIAVQPIRLQDLEALQIDKDFPWTGQIVAIGTSPTPGNVNMQEISAP